MTESFWVGTEKKTKTKTWHIKKENKGILFKNLIKKSKLMEQKNKNSFNKFKIKNNYKATNKSIDCLNPFPYLFSVLLPMTLWGCNCFNLIFQMQTKACEREGLAETHF